MGLSSTLTALPPFGYAIGICWPIRPFELGSKPKARTFKRLILCLVTRGENVQTILHTIANWPELNQLDSRIRFQIVVDMALTRGLQKKVPEFVEIVLVPQGFRPPKAKYKARALEYARIYQKLTSKDWVLHLDEETQVDEYAVKACLDFIERGDRQFAMVGSFFRVAGQKTDREQGTILYNSSSHWTSAFLTIGETTRITDDFGRFRLPFKTKKRPFLGYVHGSFIMINGEVENAVTWDTDCLAEDFWFGYRVSLLFQIGGIFLMPRRLPTEAIPLVGWMLSLASSLRGRSMMCGHNGSDGSVASGRATCYWLVCPTLEASCL